MTNISAASAQSSVVSLAPALRWLMISQEHEYQVAELVASCRPRHNTAKLLGNAVFHRLCPTAYVVGVQPDATSPPDTRFGFSLRVLGVDKKKRKEFSRTKAGSRLKQDSHFHIWFCRTRCSKTTVK